MTVTKPHILLLDEPTNHLDMDSRQALAEAINAFEGTVVIISHDPHVLELTVDRFWLVEGGKVRPFDGDMEDYRNHLLGGGSSFKVSRDNGGNGGDKKDARRQAAANRNALGPLKKLLTAAEKHVATLESERTKIKATMADPKLYSKDIGKLLDLQKALGQVEKTLATAENEWISLQEEWERAQAPEPQASNG